MDYNEKSKKNIPIYRIAVLGLMGVGKTNIISQFVNNFFDSESDETQKDIRIFQKLIDVNSRNPGNPQYVFLNIEDIFGLNHPCIEEIQDKQKKQILIEILENKPIKSDNKEQHRIFMQKQIYGYIFVYDMKQKQTLDYLIPYIDFVNECEDKKYNGVPQWKAKKFLVGNKIDFFTEEEREKNRQEELKEFKNNYDLQIVHVSALENYNIDQLFEDIAKSILNEQKIEFIEKDWYESRRALFPKKKRKESSLQNKINKLKLRKNRAKSFSDKMLISLGCAQRGDDDSDDEKDNKSSDDDVDHDVSIPTIDHGKHNQRCDIY